MISLQDHSLQKFLNAQYACLFYMNIYLLVSCLPGLRQVVTERETEVRNAQEQSSRLQTELTRLRQELQDKASQEETLRQQMTEKEEKTRKAIVYAKQKISQLMGEQVSLILQPMDLR